VTPGRVDSSAVDDDSDSEVDHEVERARRTLAAMVRLQGMTLQELDQRTGHQRGYYSQILGGRLALRYRHVAEALDALEIDRRFFFQMVYPTPRELAQSGELFRLLGYPAEQAAADEPPADAEPVPAEPQDEEPSRGKPGPGRPKRPKRPSS
jgi:hypothetical protein